MRQNIRMSSLPSGREHPALINLSLGLRHKPLTFAGRVREAIRLVTGRQKVPSYRNQDLSRIVDYVVRRTRAERGRIFNSYDAASTQRWREDWGTGTDTPYSELHGYIGTIRARSRDLYKNDFTYRSAVNTLINKAVGVGLWPKPKIYRADGSLDVEQGKQIEQHFAIYANRKQWDSRKKFSFVGEGQRMMLKTVILSGDALLNAVQSERGAYLPFAWQMCEADRLDDTIDAFKRYTWQSGNVKQTVHGISLDEYGRPVSYKFKGIDAPIPAENILHSFMTDRPEQYVGLPLFIAALDSVYDKHDLFEDFVLKSRAISKILWFLSTKNDDNPGADDKDADSVITLENAVQMRGEEAPQDVHFPDNVNDTIGPVLKFLMHGICAAGGTSYSTVMRDMEGVNFAASQHVDIQDWEAIDILRDFFVDDFCNPFYERFLRLDIALGRTNISPADYLKEPWRFEGVAWVGAGKHSVNQYQEAQANNIALANGTKTLGDVVNRTLGKDLDDHLDELAAERGNIKQRGLEDIIPTPKTAALAQEPQNPDKNDEPATVGSRKETE